MDNKQYIQIRPTTLSTGVSAGGTSMVVAAIQDLYKNTLTMSDFGDTGYFTMEPGGKTNSESGIFTGISSTTISGISWTLAKAPYTAASGFKNPHAAGVRVLLFTNTAAFFDNLVNKDNDETITGKHSFPSSEAARPRSIADTDTTVDEAYITFGQLARQAIAGASDATETVAGLVEEATQSEVDAGTAAGSVARIFVTPAKLMAHLQGQPSTYLVEDGTGSDDTYTTTATPTLSAYTTGQVFRVKLTVANTAAATLNIDSLGAKAIKKYVDGALADIETGDIVANYVGLFEYDGTNFVLLSMTATTPTTAILSEMNTFFGATDITPAEAETLTDGSDVETEHIHNILSLENELSTEATFIGQYGDGLTEDVAATGTVDRTLTSTRLFSTTSGDRAALWLALGVSNDFAALTEAGADFDDDLDYKFLASIKFSGIVTQDALFGFADGSPVNSTPVNGVEVDEHAAFIIDDATIYASNADGSTQKQTDVSSGITLTNFNEFRVVRNAGVDIKFYINGTLVATHTTNLPDSSDEVVPMLNYVGRSSSDQAMFIKHPFIYKVTSLT